MIRLTNGMKIPETKEETIALRESLQKTATEVLLENPNQIFKENMDNGFLFKVAQTDAMNSFNTYCNLYISIQELDKILIDKFSQV